MERIIEIQWEGIHGEPYIGDALVEFIRYDEDGKIVNEIINVFLPEHVPANDRRMLKEEVATLFHSGEGYNL